MRPVWVDKGLALIEAYDAIDLVGLHDQLTGLGLADQFERVVHRRLTEILGPPIVPPAPKVVKLKGPSERQAKMEARRAEIETKLELGRRLLELRAKVRWGNEFGRQRRKLFDVDTLTACELMRVARVYGERPEIWQRLSWQALVQLSAPSLPAKHREQFERRTIAGEGIKGSEIARGSMQAADRAAEGGADGGIGDGTDERIRLVQADRSSLHRTRLGRVSVASFGPSPRRGIGTQDTGLC